jgi:hypothetical protein
MSQTASGTPPRSKRPQRPPSYNEEADEAPKLLEEEPVDVEESHPAYERSSVQSEPQGRDKEPPVFEE